MNIMAMANVKELPFITHLASSSAEPTFQTVDTSISNENYSSVVSEPSTSDYHNLEESGRGCRTKRKQIDPLVCPVCSVTIRPNELESHYHSELTKLDKLSSNGKRKSSTSTMNNNNQSAMPAAGASSSESSTNESIAPEKCWETYQTVKANRQSRLKLKSRKRRADDVVVCPVCNQSITGDVNQHVEDCLRRNGDCNSDDDDEDVDVDVDGDDFGEYEWAGQHRVRASSMLEGGYAAAGIGTRIKNVDNIGEEEDLVVDGDDDIDKYGPAQYTERDIMLANKGSEDKNQTTLRLAIIGDNATNSSGCTIKSSQELNDDSQETSTVGISIDDENDNTASNTSTQNPTIEALKQRVRELEKCESIKGQYKCLICMGRYKTPVISICCWHVHCELCWLKTLGIKKLCPQCNMITSPTDLRKVYI